MIIEQPTRNARLIWRINRPEGVLFPRGERFAAPARFEQQGADWTANAWSLLVVSVAPVQRDASQRVSIRFLMAEAPQEWLCSGCSFQLYEGKLLLADGVIE